MKTDPLISVVVAAYNAASFIDRTLQSVLAQTYQNFEVLIVDDGSSDHTPQIVETYLKKDSRFRLLQQRNAGVAAARNRGIQLAKGAFIAPLDADDIWFPEYLAALLDAMTSPKVGMAYAWSVFIDENDRLMKPCQSQLWQGRDWLPLVYRNLPGNASCVLIRKECLTTIGGYDPTHRRQGAQGCEDWDLYLRLAEQFEVRVVPQLLVGYRQVQGSMSSNVEPMRRGLERVLAAVAERNPALNLAVYRWSRSNFDCYLSQKCAQAGHHHQALRCLKTALQLDYMPLMRGTVYRIAIGSLLKLCLQPISSKLWSNHAAWVGFKQGVGKWYRTMNPFYKTLNLTQLTEQQIKAKQRFPRHQYEQFLAARFCKIQQRSTAVRSVNRSKASVFRPH